MNNTLLSAYNLPNCLADITKTPKTLFDLLNKYRVIIPGIQRHYVQGADTAKARDVRTTFIRDIFGHIKRAVPLSLDFIYGPIDTSGTDAFIPIDGQQRLTTLWLLARYFADSLAPAGKRAVVNLLSRFSYEGRPHAARFCTAFTAEDSAFVKAGRRPSDSIRRSTWFNPYWVKDETVSGMLNVLDVIAETHGQEAFKGLEPITGLEYMCSGLTFELRVEAFADDIYMKMNARGLTLTQWENFKGRFSDRLKTWDLREHSDAQADWDKRIEALSDAYFAITKKHLPDNAFFAYCARMVAYESRKTGQNLPDNLAKLARFAGSSVDWKRERDHVPYDEFEALFKADDSAASTIAKTFLALLAYVTPNAMIAGLPCPYWSQGRTLIEAAFEPANRNELDFSLCLYAYFKVHSAPKQEAFRVALRLMWNVLENVDPGAPDQYYKRVDAIKALIDDGDESLYQAQMTFEGKDVQYLEEAVKGTVYATGQASDIAQMQRVEALLHGRIRLGILDLNSDNKPDFKRSRLAVLEKLLAAYQEYPEQREKLVLMAVAAAPIHLQDEIALRADKLDGLRTILTNRNDRSYQESLIDFLVKAGQNDPISLSPEVIQKANRSQLPGDAPWWERDFRENVLHLADLQSAYRTRNPEFKLFERTVRRHNTGHHYLYAGANIPKALPINDYRIELLSIDHDWPLKTDPNGFSVEMNDGNTHSGRPQNENLMVYFFPDHIEVRQWNSEAKHFDDDRTVSIPPNGQLSSPTVILAELQRILDGWVQ